ncbi:unnamed protein product, partial [Meganyctiphanes norvegica]
MVKDSSLGSSQCGTPLGTPAATPKHKRDIPSGLSYCIKSLGTPAASQLHRAVISSRNEISSDNSSMKNECRRTENILKIWILEVKGVQNKKRYYCNLVVDSQLRHSTVVKQKMKMCFWGEYFQIDLE